MNPILQAGLIALAAIIILGGIGTIIHFGFSGYKALAYRGKSGLQNFVESIIELFKLLNS